MRTGSPLVSVIVCTRNRAKYLRQTLSSLTSLEHDPAQFEIVIVDNGSADDTKAVAKRHEQVNPDYGIRYVYEPEPGLLSARHRGAIEAEGEILAYVDDDVLVAKNWLSRIVATFNDFTVHIVGGPSLPLYENDPPLWIETLWKHDPRGKWLGSLSLLDFGRNPIEIDPIFVWGLNYSIRKDSLVRLGGFHPDCIPKHLQRFQGNGETGLSLKAREKGMKAMYQPGALVYHVIPKERLTIEYFEERRFYQGVCDSYASLRRNGGQREDQSTRNSKLWALHRPSKAIKRAFKSVLPLKNGKDPHESINQRLRKAYLAGYEFHQSEVAEDPSLLEWVLKGDYWDYRLPIATENIILRGDSL